jgi:3-hydroxymyristoyl/3-hydroxydecanoyl-(acyl carrier protein) dehydratase
VPSTRDELDALLRRARRRPLFDPSELPAVDESPEALLPHRPPMLLLQRVVGLDAEGGRGVGRRHLAAEDPGFDGHFPGDPLYPGVLQIEIAGQLALWVARRRAAERTSSLAVRLVRVLDAAFLAEVRPGSELTVLSMLFHDDGLSWTSAAQILLGRTIACVCAFDAMPVEGDA